MKSMTIHQMDDLLAEHIEQRAQENGESLNSTIKGLLAKALGLSAREGEPQGYRRFLGTWSEEEAGEFDSAVADFGRIDPGDWRL
jgi:hypothetical protein